MQGAFTAALVSLAAMTSPASGAQSSPAPFAQSPSSGAAAAPAPFTENWLGFAPALTWKEGVAYGNWVVRYTGFGSVAVSSGPAAALELAPGSAATESTTHAALVTSTQSFGDVRIFATLTTLKQVRTGVPNPWEVGWILWHYRDDQHFYYFILKPNGWELGKKAPGSPGQQNFLLAGSTPTFTVGSTHTVDVLQVGPTIQVAGDGMLLGTYVDRSDPYLSGAVGLYTEDARVQFGPLVAQAVP